MKRVFLYWGPHKLHAEWGHLVCEKSVAIIPRWLPHSWRFVMPVTQFFSLIMALFTPRADTYFLEGFNCIIPAYLKKRKGTKIIMINSDTTTLLAPQWKGLKGWFYRRMMPAVDGMISTSPYVKELADKEHRVPNQIVYPYVDERFFSLKAGKNNNFIQIGGLRDSKGTDILLEVFKELQPRLKNKLFLAGPVLENRYKDASQEAGVQVTGWTDQPEMYLKQAGIYVNLARHEPFGVSVLEGMAAGLIPLVSEYCGVKEAVAAVDPRLVVPLDKNVIRERLLWIIQHPRRKELALKARKIAKKYTKEACMKSFLIAFTALEEEIHG